MESEQPIVIKKKKGGHGGHHGGAWKVAYADFVTAMMALFIVLWLMSSTSKQTQEEIAGYFRDPKGTSAKKGMESKPGEIKEKKKDDMAALKKDLLQAIQNINALNKLKKQIEVTITDEGLRIELIEDAKGTFFESGSAKPTPALIEILGVLANQLKTLPNKISIEGHTDAQQYANSTAYGNWELSTDRANVARREMQKNGVRLDQISQVRGFADQRLHYPLKPFDAGNRRVSLVVQNLPDGQQPGIPGGQVVAASGTGKGAPEAKDAPKEGQPSPAQTASTTSAAVMPPAAPKPAAGLFQKAKGMFR
jgi:chemotaxis protein MotB